MQAKARSLENDSKGHSLSQKNPAKGFIIDPRDPIVDGNGNCKQLPADFGNKHVEFSEDIDLRCSKPLIPEMETSIIADSDHAHDLETRKSVTGLI